MQRPMIRLLQLRHVPVLQQLRLEEALLRNDARNWCITNSGSDPPVVVMGISGKPERLLDLDRVQRDGVPVIRRYSGGGTVVVDRNTHYVSFICNASDVDVPYAGPRGIMAWTGALYASALQHYEKDAPFQLRENDYTLGQRKFGGNAQCITNKRWLHHTSFLWDYDQDRMSYLTLPAAQPAYRAQRPHEEFLCRMRDHCTFESPEEFRQRVVRELGLHFVTEHAEYKDAAAALRTPHLTRTELVDVGMLLGNAAMHSPR